MQLKRIVDWFALVSGVALALYVAAFVWWQVELPGDEEYSVANKLTAAAKQVSSYPNQQVLFSARRGAVDIEAYGFMDVGSQEKLLAVLRTNMAQNPTKVRVAFYPPRVMRETKGNGVTYGELERTGSVREVKLN